MSRLSLTCSLDPKPTKPPQALDEPSERDKFQHLVPNMLGVLGATLNSQDEASAQDVLEMLIEVGCGGGGQGCGCLRLWGKGLGGQGLGGGGG